MRPKQPLYDEPENIYEFEEFDILLWKGDQKKVTPIRWGHLRFFIL